MDEDLEKMKAEEPENKESDTEKTDADKTEVKASEVEKPVAKKRTAKKLPSTRDLIVNVPTMKSLGLDKVEEISRNMNRLRNVPNIERELGLNRLTDITRKANQFANMSNIPKKSGLGDMLMGLNSSSFSQLSKLFVDSGIIKNAGAVQAAMAPSMSSAVHTFGYLNQIKAMDAVISFREMASNLNVLKNSTIPHMSFYRGIFDTIDEDTYNILTDEIVEEDIIEEIEMGEESSVVEDVVVARPEFLHIALTINTYVTVTENHVQSSPDVTADEKKAWAKVAKPILNRIIGMFLSWAFGYSMDGIMAYFAPFEKIAELSDEYHYPIETTDAEPEVVKDVDVDGNNEP